MGLSGEEERREVVGRSQGHRVAGRLPCAWSTPRDTRASAAASPRRVCWRTVPGDWRVPAGRRHRTHRHHAPLGRNSAPHPSSRTQPTTASCSGNLNTTMLTGYRSSIAPNGNLSQNYVTCHMGSHRVTCHATQVNPSHAGRNSIYLYPGEMKGWVDLGVGYIPRWLQWHSRTFGRPGRWSNLPPFRLRFLKLESLFKA